MHISKWQGAYKYVVSICGVSVVCVVRGVYGMMGVVKGSTDSGRVTLRPFFKTIFGYILGAPRILHT